MASKPVKKYASGYYYIKWNNERRSPGQIWESLKTKSITVANKRKAELEAKYYNGEHDPWVAKWYESKSGGDFKNIRDLLELYIYHKTHDNDTGQWSEYTVKNDGSRLRRFVMFTGERKPPSVLNEKTIRDFLDNHGKSGYTKKSDLAKIMAFVRWCYKCGHINKMPEVKIKRPAEKLPEFLTDEMLERLYQWKHDKVTWGIKKGFTANPEINQYWMIDAWKLAAGTGLRKKEIMNVKVHHIRDGMIKVGEGYITKGRSQRMVPALFEARGVIDRYTDKSYRYDNPMLSQSDFLFGREGPEMATKLSRQFTAGCRDLWPNETQYTLHSLRHTFAIRYLTAQSSGDSMDFRLFKLQKILGHRSRTTTEIYLNMVPGSFDY